MSNLSTQVFGDMNYLYEHIANRDIQQLNENSEHYDEEFTELVEDIFYNISYSMASEGYSANAILDFLAKASEEDILEKYYDCTISEGLVSEEYILEQLQLIDEGIGSALVKLGRGAVKGTLGFAKRLSTAGSGAMKGGGGVRDALGAMGKSTQRAVKQSGVVTKVKDLAKGAKAALTSPTAKKIGLGALGLGAATGAGYVGAKLAGAGSGQGPSPTGGKPESPGSASNADFMKGSALAKLGGREGRIKDGEFRSMNWSQQSKERYNKAKGAATPPPAPKLPAPAGSGGGSGSGGGGKPAKPAAPAKPAPAKLGNTSFERRTPTSAELKGAQEYKASNPNAKPEDVLKAAQEAGKKQKSVDTDVAKFNKPEQLNKPAPAGSALAAEQERRKAQASATQKESYDAYELVLEYLFDYGHADTIEEAEYLMTELDESFIQSLVETYHANLLAEEVEEWVNELVKEGYDLSEYTWDDMVDYYFTEAREDEGLTPLQKIRKRNKNYAIEGEPAGDQTSNRRAERSSQRGVKKQKGEKSAFGTMRHVGGPYKD